MLFQVKAYRGASGVTALTLDAVDAADAISQAQTRGFAVISLQAKARAFRLPRLSRGGFPLVLFTQELLFLLQAGLSLVEAIETLADREQRPEAREALAEIVARLHEGFPLSHALQQVPQHFPPLYVAMVKASEKTGALAESLTRYIDYQNQVDRVRRQVVSASIYPALLGLVGGLVTLFLLTYVVPRFSQIFADTGRDLPWLSQLLMSWGQLLADQGGTVLAVALALAGLAAYGISRPVFRRWFVQTVWRLPGIGARIEIYQLARFYRSLGMLLHGGMPVMASLNLAASLLPVSLRARLDRATNLIREGQPISLAMERHGLSTPIARRLLVVGERTGRMGEMMERVASFHEDETARWVDSFTRLFEPLLMVFIGGIIGVVVLLMYFPIFELAGSIQ